MEDIFLFIFIALYATAIIFVVFHSLFDAHLILHYILSHRKRKPVSKDESFLPFVTIQLPVYNEVYVIKRLLKSVLAIDYPCNKLEIQVLDDSTDETSNVIAETIASLSDVNVQIHHIQRSNRNGYKAGALKHGLSMAKGEFIAVFDADFLPHKNFLKETIPFFTDAKVGMTQTKWTHVNKDVSLLARLQAIALDGHFTIEQQGRHAAGYFINFNGTAGVWRRQAIIDAGNWQADTLTEDLDLSYRAQMKGWKFKYLESFSTPAELPPLVSALKSQQYRWTKGGAETARKNLKTLMLSRLPLSVKLHGMFHLIYSFGFISIITYALLTVPLLFVKQLYPDSVIFKFSALIGFSFFIYIVHYFISYYNNTEGSSLKRLYTFLIYFPLFVSLFIGISLSNAVGIVKGYLGIRSDFIRTPKFNSTTLLDDVVKNKYAQTKIGWLTVVEGILILYFFYGLLQALHFKNYQSVPLLLMAFTGFLMVFGLTIAETRNKAIVPVYE